MRLRGVLDSEPPWEPESVLRTQRQRDALSMEELVAHGPYTADELEEFESLGLITSREEDGRRVFPAVDVDVVDAMARLNEAGFSWETGFESEDVVMYLDALRGLREQEVQLFFARIGPDRDPDQLVAMARLGIEAVNPLILALRRKLIREFLEAIPVGG
ncbi:MAG: hypothetical protein JRI25_22435 [Deltaproteobacteria bacterium]|nr:hypothetical protein [Deltaproteobacteria bacterium]